MALTAHTRSKLAFERGPQHVGLQHGHLGRRRGAGGMDMRSRQIHAHHQHVAFGCLLAPGGCLAGAATGVEYAAPAGSDKAAIASHSSGRANALNRRNFPT